LALFAGLVGFLFGGLYGTLPALIPKLVDEFGLSATEVGLLTATFSIGMLLATPIAGYATNRIGPAPTAAVGISITAIGTVAFAFSD
jgi:MFS family permease